MCGNLEAEVLRGDFQRAGCQVELDVVRALRGTYSDTPYGIEELQAVDSQDV